MLKGNFSLTPAYSHCYFKVYLKLPSVCVKSLLFFEAVSPIIVQFGTRAPTEMQGDLSRHLSLHLIAFLSGKKKNVFCLYFVSTGL